MHGIDVLKEGALPILCHKCAPWQVNHIKNSQPWKLHQPHFKKIWIVQQVHQPPSENSSPPPLSLTSVVNFAQLGHLLLQVLALAHFALHCVEVQYAACIFCAVQGCCYSVLCAFNVQSVRSIRLLLPLLRLLLLSCPSEICWLVHRNPHAVQLGEHGPRPHTLRLRWPQEWKQSIENIANIQTLMLWPWK